MQANGSDLQQAVQSGWNTPNCSESIVALIQEHADRAVRVAMPELGLNAGLGANRQAMEDRIME